MPRFIFAYHGAPNVQTRENCQAHMQDWLAWRRRLGAAVVDPGYPVGPSKSVSATGVQDYDGPAALQGVTIVEASTMEEALAMAASCPHVTSGGTLEVAEAVDMPM